MKHLTLFSNSLAIQGLLIYHVVTSESVSFWGIFFSMATIGLVTTVLSAGIEAQRVDKPKQLKKD